MWHNRIIAMPPVIQVPKMNSVVHEPVVSEHCDPDDMSAAERELAADAEWKIIQQNTFTRWANEHLKQARCCIENLEEDLSDGLKLVALIEVLSQNSLPRHNKRPNFRSQKLENVSVALQYLEKHENIRIVNIDSTDIVDCKLKLILGLIWTLILHYSISLPRWEGEDDTGSAVSDQISPKQRLLQYIQNRVPELPVTNFTNVWKDGTAIGALVDSVGPGLCPDWPDWKSRHPLKNATDAMTLAKDWLGVPQLITPVEMVNPNCDEMSMMTYLSQYPNAKLKEGAPLKSRTDISKIKCYGPGVDSNERIVGMPTNFTIETLGAGNGDLEAFITCPNRETNKIQCQYKNDRFKSYIANYTPAEEGRHSISVTYNDIEVPKSPFTITFNERCGDASKLEVCGPGIEAEGVTVNKPTYFEILTENCGKGLAEVMILDTLGKRETIPFKVVQLENGVYRCDYVAPLRGFYSVNVFYNEKHAPGSPFGVTVAPAFDARRVKAYGRGLQPFGIRVKDAADFIVSTEGAGEGKLIVKVIGPGGTTEPTSSRDLNEFMKEFVYHPNKVGKHSIVIRYNEEDIYKSPFDVQVGAFVKSKVMAYGSGLKGGVSNYPAVFAVDTNGEIGTLGFSIEGPSQAKISCIDNGDGSANVTYLPTLEGEYAIHINCDNEDIPDSPYMAYISPETDFYPNKVMLSGSILSNDKMKMGEVSVLKVDASKAGQALLDVQAMRPGGLQEILKAKKIGDDIYEIPFEANLAGKHTVQVNYGGVCVPMSPFCVHATDVTDPNAVVLSGPGIGKEVKVGFPTQFNIDCSEAGPGDIKIALTNDGVDVPLNVDDNGDGTFKVKYEPVQHGRHKLTVLYADVEIDQSPFLVNVSPNFDLSQVKIEDLPHSGKVGVESEFFVNPNSLGKLNGIVTCIVTSSNGGKKGANVRRLPNNSYKVSYTPKEAGTHHIDVFYDGLPVSGSPFEVEVSHHVDASKCRAFGPGLTHGHAGEPNMFTVETKGAGPGALALGIVGPSESELSVVDNRDGSCTVHYVAYAVGDYEISIKFSDQDIPNSPFQAKMSSIVGVEKVAVYGKGIDPRSIRANKLMNFIVDASKIKPQLPLQVQIDSEDGEINCETEVVEKSPGIYDVNYAAPNEGDKIDINVKIGEEHVIGSPFKCVVLPLNPAEKVQISGAGVSSKGVPASIPAEFLVDSTATGNGELGIACIGPDGEPRQVKIVPVDNNVCVASYVPDDCGTYQVNVTHDACDVTDEPIQVTAFPVGKAEECRIIDEISKVAIVGTRNRLKVDAKNSGDGSVTCKVLSPSQRKLPVEIEETVTGLYNVEFTPEEAGGHKISLKYGGNPIPNGFYTLLVVASSVAENGYEKVDLSENSCELFNHSLDSTEEDTPKFRTVELKHLSLPSTSVDDLFVEVKMPSGDKGVPTIVDNRDGTVSFKYDPKEEGVHELLVKCNGSHIQGSPFKFHIDTISSGYVTAYGSGLIHGISGEPAYFTVSTKNAGSGGLSVSVEGPSKADLSCHDNKDGTVSVNYLPISPGEYKVSVKFDEKHIKGSPFSAKITGEGRKRSQISLGNQSEVSFPGKIDEKEFKTLNASIAAPSGLEEPCFIKKLASGQLGISFTPREIGQHLVSIKKLGYHISGSPFKAVVSASEVGDASKVKITGKGLLEGETHIYNEFCIYTKDAGYGGLSLSIEGPSKAEIKCGDSSDGKLSISYKPTEPGYYIANVKFADHHVRGSPFTIKVTGKGGNSMREQIQRACDAAPLSEVGSKCQLTVRLPNVTTFDLSSSVISPGDKVDSADLCELEPGLFGVSFTPKESGVHTVSLKFQEMHIPGSPFRFTVGPLKDGGSHRVHCGGPGLERGEVQVLNEFNVWTREAGAGNLAVSVEGPSKAVISVKDRGDGSYGIGYKVSETGDYRIGIKFNEKHVPESPFKVFVTPQMGDARKVEIGQFPDQGSVANKAVNFLIMRNGAPKSGHVDCKVVSPSGAPDDCFIDRFDDDIHSVRFVPRDNGVHNIHVTYDGIHIPGSPFRLRIGKDDADPAAVEASGIGLVDATSGQKMDFLVNTCNAGKGTLAVTVDGPSKVSMDCTEVEEGYKVRYTPLTSGDYYIGIKFNGHHIADSPYKVKCTGDSITDKSTIQESSSVVVETADKSGHGKAQQVSVMPHFQSDVSQVTCKGIGLKKAHTNRANNFTVDASNAGSNILYVGVFGPKSPCEEVHVKHTGYSNYSVSYLVAEPGEYFIGVIYGKEHVPGSPFHVQVF